MSKPPQLKKGDVFGDWEIEFLLGKGGNGTVWSARRVSDKTSIAAIKVLQKTKSTAVARFHGEIQILREHSDIPGILPILDFDLREDVTAEEPSWYAMPRATPLKKTFRRHAEETIAIVQKLARTLSDLHSRGVSHRDVKPENLLVWNDEPHVADFGLADFPDKPDLTGKGETLGPRWTIAPEMRRSPTTADGRNADVYSMAKTLWILLSNDPKCFDGRYSADEVAISLKNYLPTTRLLHVLDDLLFRATATDPLERPSMGEFASVLEDWLVRHREFSDVSLGDWQQVQKAFFPHAIPERVAWENPKSIVAILNLLGATAEYNHTFAPNGGGLDIEGASESFELGCIELRFEANITVILKPKRLMFESFPGEYDWAYFRLESVPLAPVSETNDPFNEELVELGPCQYAPRNCWETGFYEQAGNRFELPATARPISRYFKGSFLIVAKASQYNQRAPYDGRHDRFSADEFRQMMEKALEARSRKALE